MANVSVTKTITAPATTVWNFVSEWGGTHKWIPGVGPVTVVGDGPGSTRSADLDPATGFPGRITERLDAFDPAAMQFRYRVVGDVEWDSEEVIALIEALINEEENK